MLLKIEHQKAKEITLVVKRAEKTASDTTKSTEKKAVKVYHKALNGLGL